MMKTLKDFVSEAKAQITTISPAEASAAADIGEAIILDVREPGELQKEGRLVSAVHVPRGLLEPKADPDASPEDALIKAKEHGRAVHVLCATGVRATLAAETLRQMGYNSSVITGGFKNWQEAGIPIAH